MRFDAFSDDLALLLILVLCPALSFLTYSGLKLIGDAICDYKERRELQGPCFQPTEGAAPAEDYTHDLIRLGDDGCPHV